MIAVIFEVEISEGKQQDYLALANELRPLLENIDGFISIERFQSLSVAGKILSLSFWRDEEAVKQWRNIEQHRLAQAKGRNDIFKNFRLSVVEVMRDYNMTERQSAPQDSVHFHGDN